MKLVHDPGYPFEAIAINSRFDNVCAREIMINVDRSVRRINNYLAIGCFETDPLGWNRKKQSGIGINRNKTCHSYIQGR
jgi:hypothetical protein